MLSDPPASRKLECTDASLPDASVADELLSIARRSGHDDSRCLLTALPGTADRDRDG
jgi:hypothetical protein